MEYTVYVKKSPKSKSSTLHAKNPSEALDIVAEYFNTPVRYLAVTDFAHYEDYKVGLINRDQLILASLHKSK